MTSTRNTFDIVDQDAQGIVCSAEGVPGVSVIDAIQPTDPIDSSSDALFVQYLRDGEKERSAWKTGIEMELFGFREGTFERIDTTEIRRLLETFVRNDGELVMESGVAVEAPFAGTGRITIEPGGQIEFSGFPRRTLAGIAADTRAFQSALRAYAAEHAIIFAGIGFDPFAALSAQKWYPKPRYGVMRPYLAGRGSRSWDMMSRTCSVQVNVDYESEADLRLKFIVGNRLAPIVSAMFANSPFENGTISGFKSSRADVWLNTDSDRSGISPAAIEDNFSYDKFVEYAIEVPAIFVRRNGEYLGAHSGTRFKDFLSADNSSTAPIFQDWTDQLSTIFTEARLKQYIELRSIDSGSPEMALAGQAFWKGLLYDQAALETAFALAPKLGPEQWLTLREAVAVDGLAADVLGINVLALAKELVELATTGLKNVAPYEIEYIEPLRQLVCVEEICPADILLKNWHGSWNGSMARVLEYVRVA